MRILLIAYDFPPIPSPQSLRWAYLARELVAMGHEMSVLAPDLPGYGPGGLPTLPDSMTVHRVFPGIVMRMLSGRASRRPTAGALPSQIEDLSIGRGVVTGAGSTELNWKGVLVYRVLRMPNWKAWLATRVKGLADLFLYPDARAEWFPWARRELDRILRENPPDVVVTSHEPANSIALGLRAKRKGFRWVADLGDPILAPYTPARWRRRAWRLERAICNEADHVTVTSTRAAAMLRERHGLGEERCSVIHQGFDPEFDCFHVAGATTAIFDSGTLELLYTGSFYSFRRIGALLDAVTGTPGVRLNVATIVPPIELLDAAREYPASVRILGFLPHSTALALQRRCDVLVNLANEDPVQVPGKLYEYLGASAPVLHIGGGVGDAALQLLEETGAGVCEPNVASDIARRLAGWRDHKALGHKLERRSQASGRAADFRWDRLAGKIVAACNGGAPA